MTEPTQTRSLIDDFSNPTTPGYARRWKAAIADPETSAGLARAMAQWALSHPTPPVAVALNFDALKEQGANYQILRAWFAIVRKHMKGRR
jgi:hypothetical protein